MVQFLVECYDDHLINYGPLPTSPSYNSQFVQYHLNMLISSFSYMSKLIIKSINTKAELYAGEPRDTKLVIRVSDPYEAFILALHLDVDKYYLNEDKVCRLVPISSLELYNYGLRKIYEDIPGISRLLNEIYYIVLLDVRRHAGDIKAIFNELKRFHKIEPEEAILITFTGLGEPIYETLGAYVLRYRGYLVAHQGLISRLLPPPYRIFKVPDLELAYVGDKGAFLYELSLLKYLGKDMKLNIISTGVGEAKGSKYDFSEGVSQVFTYLDLGLYDEGYVIVPEAMDKIEYVKAKGIGLITWDYDGTPIIIQSERKWGIKERVEAFKSMIDTIIHPHLIMTKSR